MTVDVMARYAPEIALVLRRFTFDSPRFGKLLVDMSCLRQGPSAHGNVSEMCGDSFVK